MGKLKNYKWKTVLKFENILIALIFGGLSSWKFKETATQILLMGKTFFGRSQIVQIGLLIIYGLLFSVMFLCGVYLCDNLEQKYFKKSSKDYKSNRKLSFVYLIILCVLFAFAQAQPKLFSSNQNTYFLRGLSETNYGHLSNDWLSNQTDNIPLFTSLVKNIHYYNMDWLFFVIQEILMAIYCWSIFFIVRKIEEHKTSAFRLNFMFFVIFFIYSSYSIKLISDFFKISQGIINKINHFAKLASNGMAGQYLGNFFQPSEFGVLILLSIMLFLYKKEYISIIILIFVATMHPTYILHAAVLTASYFLILVSEKKYKKAIFVSILSAILVLPIVIFTFMSFYPTNQDIYARGQHILAEIRIPHHAKISQWFDIVEISQLIIIFLGITLSRKNKRLFYTLIISTLSAIVLTLIQIVTGNLTLSLLFPWRLSVWLVPLSFSIIVLRSANIIKTIIIKYFPQGILGISKRLFFICLLFLVIPSSYMGIRETINNTASVREKSAAENFAIANYNNSDVYLIPVELENFRLNTGIPIFIDWKSHPYKDIEIIEWYNRVEIVKKFYQSGTKKEVIESLSEACKKQLITKILVYNKNDVLFETDPFRRIYRDDEFSVYYLGRYCQEIVQ